MNHLDDRAIRVMTVLEEHRKLDVPQIASLAELSVSGARDAVKGLVKIGLVTCVDGIYSLNAQALGHQLDAAVGELQAA